jgi:hypothetical protein
MILYLYNKYNHKNKVQFIPTSYLILIKVHQELKAHCINFICYITRTETIQNVNDGCSRRLKRTERHIVQD